MITSRRAPSFHHPHPYVCASIHPHLHRFRKPPFTCRSFEARCQGTLPRLIAGSRLPNATATALPLQICCPLFRSPASSKLLPLLGCTALFPAHWCPARVLCCPAGPQTWGPRSTAAPCMHLLSLLHLSTSDMCNCQPTAPTQLIVNILTAVSFTACGYIQLSGQPSHSKRQWTAACRS